MQPQLSLVVPFYNERELAAKSVAAMESCLEQSLSDFEIIFSDDGSTDGTIEILEQWTREDCRGRRRFIGADRHRGKGAALTRGLRAARAESVVYIDADLEIDPQRIHDVVRGLEEGFDLCVGVKDSSRTTTVRSWHRNLAHFAYNGLVRLLLHSTVRDHSCGLKAFRRSVLLSILPSMRDEKWSWDTEFLIRAQMHGYRIKQIPISAIERRDSKVRVIRATWESLQVLMRLYRDGIRVSHPSDG